MIKTKDDVELRGYEQRPAVNVKVYKTIRDVKLPICLGGSHPVGKPEEMEWSYTEPEFTVDWVEENLEEEHFYGIWSLMCEMGFEHLQYEAEEIWSEYSVKVWSDGHSGGWTVVEGLPDVDDWDAIMLGKWRRFAKIARATADDIPYQVMTSIYMNEFEQQELP